LILTIKIIKFSQLNESHDLILTIKFSSHNWILTIEPCEPVRAPCHSANFSFALRRHSAGCSPFGCGFCRARFSPFQPHGLLIFSTTWLFLLLSPFFFLNHMASVCVYWKNRIACKTPPFGHTVLSRESCSELEPCERFRAPCHVFDILATAFCGLLTVSLRFLYSAFLAVCMSVSCRTSVAFVTRWLLLSPRG